MSGSPEPSVSTSQGSAEPELAPPPYQRIREVRLAVVMYGGVSLAIYMNGIAQELYHLVRSTARQKPARSTPTPDDEYAEPQEWALPTASLSPTERVYRKLGQLLGREDGLRGPVRPDDPILTRFVIDILSGTSAGGINAVFLAKALANDQSMESLSRLWIEEGDISKLLNDSTSTKDIPGITWNSPPTSLLNGHRMYYQLLDAFDGMDREDEEGRSVRSRTSPLADELDLYVTTTDLIGLLLPLRVKNGVLHERRYRNVFHFVYSTEDATGEQRNDFHADNNPALAFVARCTSSFPFAFEPMILEDIDPVLGAFESSGAHTYDIERHGADAASWKDLFPDYTSSSPDPIPYTRRPFGDGGALDNKPFSYATETVLRRRADLPVDRKLLYIDPDPGHPERDIEPGARPDVIQNFLSQGVTLPRQETIAEDLQRIADRNRLIQRIDRILLDVEWTGPGRRSTPGRMSGEDWADRDPASDNEEFGPAYGGYHRLKVATVSDDLTSLFARLAEIGEGSDYEVAVRAVVRAWRCHRYRPLGDTRNAKAEAGQQSENRFLIDFDLAFRLRRLNYIQRKLDELYSLDARADKVLASVVNEGISAVDKTAFRDELLYFKRVTSRIHADLRKTGRDLRKRSEENQVFRLIKGVFSRESLESALTLPDDAARDIWGEEQLRQHEIALDTAGIEIAAAIGGVSRDASERLKTELDTRDGSEDASRLLVSRFVRTTYDSFDEFDMVALPMLYGSDAGETDVIDVIRVSPEDTSRGKDGSGRSKVTGARYMHFGAFLDRIWRQNDILRGRLDAADILISSLVPGSIEVAPGAERERDEAVAQLKEEAQRAIVAQELGEADRVQIAGMIAEAVSTLGPEERNVERLKGLLEKGGVSLSDRLMPVLRTAMNDDEALRRFYENEYEVDTELPPREAVTTLGRGAHITGEMFRGVGEGRHLKPLSRASLWVSRLGRLITGAVETAVPGRLPHVFAFHLFALLYVFEGLAIVLGLVLNSGVVQRFGVLALTLTLVTNLVILVLGDWLSDRRGYRTFVKVLLILLLAAALILVVVGAAHVPGDLRTLWNDWFD